MAFTGTYSDSGNNLLYITQTGTDTELSGLTSFTYYDSANVSTNLGFALGWTGLAIYFIDVPLIINGTLSYDSSEEMLVLSTSFPDSASGFDFALRITGIGTSMSVGVQQSTNPNGTPRYSEGIGLVVGFDFTSNNPLNYIWNEGVLIDDSATLTFNGSELQLASPLKIAPNSGIVTYNGTRIVDLNNQTFSKQTLRNEAPANILRLNNVEFDAKFQPQRFINLSGLDTFSGVFKNSFIQPHRAESDPSIPPVGGKVMLSNVIFGNNANSYDWQLVGNSLTATDNQAIELTNVDIGTGVRPNQAVSGSINHLAIFQNIKIITEDTSFNLIENCRVRIPTTNSGNRNNTLIGGQFIGNLDFTGTTYAEYSSLTSNIGETSQYKVLTGRIWNDDLSSAVYTYDLYGKSQVVGEDKFDIEFRSYLHNFASQEVVLKVANDIEVKRVLTTDINISETNETLINAYTDLGTELKIFDTFKLEWLDLTLNNLILGRVGNQIDLDKTATSLIIDAMAENVRNLTGTTATAKAAIYTGGAITKASGTVTTRNGSLLSGGTFDCDVNYESGASTTLTNVTVNGILDFNSAGTYSLDGCAISEVTNSSSGNITLILLNGSTVITNNDPNTTLNEPVNIINTSIIDVSRVQINNVTKSSELDNSIVSGGSGYAFTVDLQSSSVDTGDVIELKATYQYENTAKIPLKISGVLTSTGLTFINSQENLTDYDTLGVDGSTVSEYNIDLNTENLEINANDTDCQSKKKRIVARYYYLITTAVGIDRFFNAIVLQDPANAIIDRTITNLLIDNTGNCTLNLTDNDFRLYTSDGSSWIKDPPTGGFGVISDSGKVYIKAQEQLENKVDNLIDTQDADIYKSPTTYVKKKKGTDDVLVTKTFTTDGQGNITLIETT